MLGVALDQAADGGGQAGGEPPAVSRATLADGHGIHRARVQRPDAPRNRIARRSYPGCREHRTPRPSRPPPPSPRDRLGRAGGPGLLPRPAGRAAAGVARPGALDAAMRDELSTLPPLVFAGECDQLRERLGARPRRARRSCCRAATAPRPSRAPPPTRSGTGQDRAADGRRAHLRRVDARGQDGPDGGAVRQAALQRRRDARRDGASTLPAYRGDAVNDLRVHRAGPPPRPAAAAAGLPHARVHAEPDPRLHHGGFADLRQVHEWNQGFVATARRWRGTRRSPREIDRAMSFMDACGADFDALPHGRLLLLPRGADPRLRARR